MPPHIVALTGARGDVQVGFFLNDYDGHVYENVWVWPDPYHAHAEARIVRGTTSVDRTPGWRPGYCHICGAYHTRDRPVEHRRILAVMARAKWG